MLIKLTLTAQELEALHRALESQSNFYEYCWHHSSAPARKAYVLLKSAKGNGANINTDGRGVVSPVGLYEVTLEVAETKASVYSPSPAPIKPLLNVLEAIGKFNFSEANK